MTDAYVRDFASFAANGGGRGPAWLRPLRRSAIERFSTLGFPTPKLEDWHFTSVAPIAEREFAVAPYEPAAVPPDALAPFTFGHPEWTTLVFVNGRYDARASHATAQRGMRVAELGRAWTDDPDGVLEQHQGRIADFAQAAFTALNTAFMADGAFVRIGPDVTAEAPIHLVFIATPDAAGRVMHPRTLVVADRHAKATIVESYVALDGAADYFTNAVTELVVGPGATLTHLKLQRESPRSYHVGTVQARQERDSHFVSFSYASGGALARTNIYTVLGGAGSGATLNGLYLLDDAQHVDHQTRIEHAEPNTFSREVYKGILDGSSHGVFNGKVYVRPEAQKTDGKQENNNLLLSDRARVDTKPQLEIFADDVKCTHGATVGRLDEMALFYMKSRGIPTERARKLLTYAFAAGVIETIELAPVRAALEELILHRFAGT